MVPERKVIGSCERLPFQPHLSSASQFVDLLTEITLAQDLYDVPMSLATTYWYVVRSVYSTVYVL